MKYSNPKIPESVNSRQKASESVREFGRLAMAFVVLMLAGSLVAYKGGGLLGPLIPFAWEARLYSQGFIDAFGEPGNPATEARLQELTDRLVVELEVPEDISITIHYRNYDQVNAFAFYQGHIVIFSGLLEKLESENAVAALLAHEIGHVRYRHLAQNFSGGIFLSLFYGAAVGDESPLGSAGGQIVQLELASFSRGMEGESDQLALRGQHLLYGHLGGYEELFQALDLEQEKQPDYVLRYYNSHPAIEDRYRAAALYAEANDIAERGAGILWWPEN